jgi:hypothetical protein
LADRNHRGIIETGADWVNRSLVVKDPSMWSLEYLTGRWQPGFHDDFFTGWIITGSYFACALLAALIATFHNHVGEKLAAKFWSVTTLLMVLLGLNKQLDLQILLTEMGRQIAHAQGWYAYRRVVQLAFILIFVTTFTAAFVWFTKSFRDLFRRYLLAFCGLFFLLCFIIIRAAAFHHIDALLEFRLSNVRMNRILELMGIYMIILAEFKDIMASRIRKT